MRHAESRGMADRRPRAAKMRRPTADMRRPTTDMRSTASMAAARIMMVAASAGPQRLMHKTRPRLPKRTKCCETFS